VDKEIRGRIRDATQAARGLLERDYREQLEGTYDISLDGTIAEQPGSHLSDHQKVIREKLVATIAHKRSSGREAKEAVDAYLREAPFTTLNRFVALKMLEARNLVQECVSRCEDSSGFKEFSALTPGLVAVEDKGYRLYIETIFDEIGQEVRVLFDRRDVASLLWPDRQTLLELLGILNAPELASVWAEDETIGWVYQYFNGDEERTKMRAESQAPRNSRELAVRNQFFTPRYVVQFLTDNTLGRTWYEMMQGETKLTDLDYLVRRPNEIFLADGELAPESETDESELSQEELLQQTVHVPFRAKKDPRDLRILDPACGSGHFLLYTFDLLITIYDEAWGDAGAEAFTETGTQLRVDYHSIEHLRRAMPELILRHNLHGVDIDPRAAQIAALALWMRAQRAYNQFEVDRAQRPPITKTNIVVAEPMPGDAELVDEFAASLKPAVLGDLFRKMVEEMKLAGELGSLLKIEESIATAVKEASDANQQGNLFAGKVENQDFWDTADEKIIAALGSFAESAAGSGGVRRQLFAGDAAQGVAFIKLMRKRFDVVLMNPPFGSPIECTKRQIALGYSEAKHDIDAAFVLLGTSLLLKSGQVGVIANRTQFSKGALEHWRQRALLGEFQVEHTIDLGLGVLDAAMVEAAAYVTSRPDTECRGAVFIRALDARQKQQVVFESLSMLRRGTDCHRTYLVAPKSFCKTPASRIAYWIGPAFLKVFADSPAMDPTVGYARQGLITADNFRFLRLLWEVPGLSDGPGDDAHEPKGISWTPYAKGGEYSPYFADIHLAVDWSRSGQQIRSLLDKNGRQASRPQNQQFYYRPAITYTERTASGFSPRLLPPAHLFDCKGPVFAPHCDGDVWWLLAVLMSRPIAYLLEVSLGAGDTSVAFGAARQYTQSIVGGLPLPMIEPEKKAELALFAKECWQACAEIACTNETSNVYAGTLPGLQSADQESVSRFFERCWVRALSNHWAIEQLVRRALALDAKTTVQIESEFAIHPSSIPRQSLGPAEVSRLTHLASLSTDEVVEEARSVLGASRFVMKNHHVVDRKFELVCLLLDRHPADVVEARRLARIKWREHGDVISRALPAALLSGGFGVGLEQMSSPPNCGANLSVPGVWHKRFLNDSIRPIVVDDPGNTEDVEKLARLASIGTPSGSTPYQIGEGFRQWLKGPAFDEHIAKFSCSRRKAPIYWQLATPSASYSVWCYYHRLTRDTFFRVANDYATPKVDHEERRLNELRQGAGPDPSSKQRKAIDAQETFVAELRAFENEVKRIAPLWNPNLNDGVIINFAPLWRLVPQHKPWQKECKKVWDKLVNGDYDWAHLSMHLWPERVVPKCQDDRSLAIAHGLEDEFWYEDDNGKKTQWEKRRVSSDRVAELVAERSSTAVKTALDDLLSAPTPSGGKKRKKRVVNG